MFLELIVLFFIVLSVPFIFKSVEQNLEIFLFLCGIIASLISGVLNKELIHQALIEPIHITIAVFFASILFRLFNKKIGQIILYLSKRMNYRIFLSITVILLGLASSIITAIIASLILIAIVSNISLERSNKIKFTILSCFAIGIGAILTPIGEPLATIATSKLNETFLYLFTLLGKDVILLLIFIGVLTFLLIDTTKNINQITADYEQEGYFQIIIRTLKIYLFIMGLTLLGAGFEPIIERYLMEVGTNTLYWLNIISALLDNATLAAAEISPLMTAEKIKAILMGLMISGGMLVPGNIPNIICANKLDISVKEWAIFGVPIGLMILSLYFVFFIIM